MCQKYIVWREMKNQIRMESKEGSPGGIYIDREN